MKAKMVQQKPAAQPKERLKSLLPWPAVQKWLAVLTYLGLVTILLYAFLAEWAYDDPFITYRYARSLAQGDGFVYNPGERIQSTTTPLLALLLAGLYPLWNDLPHLASLIGFFSLALGAVFLWDLARTWKTPLAGWAGLILYPTFPLLLSTIGSETPLYLALCMGAFAAYARQRYNLTAVCAALATLARPDGILVPGILGLHYLFLLLQNLRSHERGPLRQAQPGQAQSKPWQSLPWQGILIFIAISLPWFIFAWYYFGAPLPVTLAAKQQQGAMSISQRFAAGFISLAGAYAQLWQYKLAAILAALGSIFMLWRSARSAHARRWLLFLSWTALYFLAYSLLGVSRYFWYYAPLAPGFIALVGLGIDTAAEGVQLIWKPRIVETAGALAEADTPDSTQDFTSLRSHWPKWLVAGGLILLMAVGQAGDLKRLAQGLDPRAAIYRDVGLWLQENTPETAKIGALEIGIIGYYAQRPVIDFAGLIQPLTAAQLSRDTTYDEVAEWASQHYQPDYLILQAGLFPQLEAGYAAQYCQVVHQFPGQAYGYQEDLDIYACHSKNLTP